MMTLTYLFLLNTILSAFVAPSYARNNVLVNAIVGRRLRHMDVIY